MRIFTGRISRLLPLLAMAVSLVAPSLVPITHVSALSGGEFNAGNIISNAVFTNSAALSVNDIQNFLNAKVPNCDTNGAQSKSYYYNSSTGRLNNSADTWVTTSRAVYGQRYDAYNNTTKAAAPYVCLKDYVENPSTQQNNLQNPGASVPGSLTAAQIIYAAAQNYGINSQVLLVTLQKEQGIITDDWPWTNQYQIAMGYACPDTAPCDSQYYGFANQVQNAAKQFRRYLTNPSNYNYVVGTNFIRYNPSSSCGGSNVAIQNQATASLYNYTPYQPNAAALANLNDNSAGGTGDGCSAYGNRNFWWYFNKWFGSTQTSIAYAWTVASANSYVDSGRTQPYPSSTTLNMTPGGTAYVTLQARNNGYQTWSQSVVHLGTTYPGDRSSVFKNGTWLSPQRLQMQEASVAPGETATFSFSMTAPSQAGTYVEHFSLVADGITWMNDPNFYYTIHVSSPIGATNSQNTGLPMGQSISPGDWLMSPDSQTIFTLLPNGNVVAYIDFRAAWSNNVVNNDAQSLVLQSDGNLVEYDSMGRPLWSTTTSGANSHLALQTDGNVVLYSSGGVPLWSTNTATSPDHLSKVNPTIPPGGVMYPGQFMQTADRAYTLVLQPGDGNLVEYDSTGRPLWSSGTSGSGNAVVMQNDGNLVIYSSTGRPLWSTRTVGSGNSLTLQPSGILSITNGNNAVAWNNRTVLQAGQYIQTADRAYTLVLQASDGNLVEYNSAGRPVWASGTSGTGNTLIMQGDGNMVIYNRSGRPMWSTRTSGLGNIMALQSDGNIVIYSSGGRALWASR